MLCLKGVESYRHWGRGVTESNYTIDSIDIRFENMKLSPPVLGALAVSLMSVFFHEALVPLTFLMH